MGDRGETERGRGKAARGGGGAEQKNAEPRRQVEEREGVAVEGVFR